MFPFIETLRIVNGEVMNITYHQTRMNRTFAHFWPSAYSENLITALRDVPQEKGIFKARVVYDEIGILQVEYAPYVVRHIQSLKLVYSDTIDYTYKSTDRSCLSELVAQKGDADEIIIVKNGLLTDTSYSNIALYDGKSWYTPGIPLLKGTMRQKLLDERKIQEADIRPEDLKKYHKVALINAMMPLGVCEVEYIKY